MWIVNLIYGFSAKPQGIMTLRVGRDGGCVCVPGLSYVGHVENDSRASHKLAARSRLYIE